jgi:tetratricopeptide (TPR) repeat protein
MCSSAAGKKVQETTNTAQTQQGSKYVPELGKNIVTDPAVAAAQHHAGNVHVAGGRYAEGEKCLLEALQIYMWSDDQASFANSPSVMTDLGQVYFLMGKHDRCMEVLGKARELFRIGFGPRSAGEAMTLQMMARSVCVSQFLVHRLRKT